MRKKLEDIELKDFDKFPLWYDLYGDQDELEGLVESLDEATKLSSDLKQHVWCRILIKLNDNTELRGIGMYFSDSGELGNFSVYFNDSWLSLILPPAPDFVLVKDGPKPFAINLKRKYRDVFPMIIETELIESSTGKIVMKIINK